MRFLSQLRGALVALLACSALAACEPADDAAADAATIDGANRADAMRAADARSGSDADGPSDPDASSPDADASSPEPDASSPEPDASSPEPDASSPDAGSGLDATVADAAPADDAGSDLGAPPPACVHAEALEAATVAELARQGISGVALGIDMPGCTWMGAAGLADRTTSRAVVTTDRFRIASMTKTFTAAVVLQLVEEGVLELTDTLSMYVAFPGGDGITLRHLLAHTSGIADYYAHPTIVARYGEAWTHDAVIDVIRGEPLAFVPGSTRAYSNTNYFLLGMVIEAVTGHAYHDEVRSRLLTPFGLDDTYVDGPESLPGGTVRGYEHAAGSFVDVTTFVDPSLTWAAGGIVSTVADLHRWARALFTGTVLSAEMRAAMLTPEPLPGGGVAPNGLGMYIEDLPRGLGRFYSHIGRLQGFHTMFGYLPDHDAVMVQLTNDSDGGPNPFMTEMWMVVGLL